MPTISFSNQGHPYSIPNKRAVRQWLSAIAVREGYALGDLTYVFCTDDELLDINRRFLRHDYYTDVITFDYSQDKMASGDVLISIDRVKENAQTLGCQFIDELHRVIVHGLLHLMKYKDDTVESKHEMRGLEDLYLSLRSF